MKIGFIGAGNMGSALAKAAKRCAECEVYIYDKEKSKAIELSREIGAEFRENTEIAAECDYIFLAVKPNIIGNAIADMNDVLCERDGYTIVSMAAGVSISKIEGYLDKKAPVIRIMPNTPAAVGNGMILWCKNDEVTEGIADGFVKAMSGAGMIDAIEESKIDAASAISGCGPAFVFMFIEALADGGVKCGLPRDKAQKYAAQTVLGSALYMLESEKHPGQLKDAVCSPGGSTIEGVMALEAGAFRATASNAVVCAYEKTVKLGK